MSLEMHVFLEKSKLPDRAAWQKSIDSLNLPLVLHPELNPLTDSGFCPVRIGDIDSGCEIYSTPARPILETYPGQAEAVGGRNWCVTFSWGGDIRECACALAASAGLLALCDALVFDPQDGLVYDLTQLIEQTKECLK